MQKIKLQLCITILYSLCITTIDAQSLPLPFGNDLRPTRTPSLTCTYLSPQKIIWVSNKNLVCNAETILNPGIGQASLNSFKSLQLKGNDKEMGSIILDFGKEINGGIQILTTGNNQNVAGRVRIRFGESVAETCSSVGEKGATNDHAIRDQIITLPWLGGIKIGDTGFRFVRIDAVDPQTTIEIKEINASFTYRDIPYIGSFRSNDEELNQIWMTGAYTVHLNMQDYLWDGVKRDRLVWVGDLHPEIMTLNSVFGYNEVVPKSLDLIRDLTPLPGWMNGISSYSMWWILIQRDWYYYQGDLPYLKQQKTYLSELLQHLTTKIGPDGKENLDGMRFLDWPSSENPEAIHAGLQAMMILSFKAGADLAKALKDDKMYQLCTSTLSKLKTYQPALSKTKQAAALLALSDIYPPKEVSTQVLMKDGTQGMSTFYGYYILNAMAEANNASQGIQFIKEYWGAMLNLGATTFWEDFDMKWVQNAARIDEMPAEGKIDLHGSYGAFCYTGYRHSLCHGWASGPTAWLSQYVLGIEPLEPGCRTVRIRPHLGPLEWVEGSFPTPHGVIRVKHTHKDGKINSVIDAPKGIKVVR